MAEDKQIHVALEIARPPAVKFSIQDVLAFPLRKILSVILFRIR
jgi:hypothetical protein